MHRHWHNPSPMLSARRGVLRLAAVDGRLVPAPTFADAPVYGPEAPLTVEFEGLTEAEQLRALAAFPGGKRFHLARTGS